MVLAAVARSGDTPPATIARARSTNMMTSTSDVELLFYRHAITADPDPVESTAVERPDSAVCDSVLVRDCLERHAIGKSAAFHHEEHSFIPERLAGKGDRG